MKPKMVFYAHSMSWYGKPIEAKSIAVLDALGFSVLNPASHQEGYNIKGMLYSAKLIDKCDAVAFSSFKDGKIGSGVQWELDYAQSKGLPIFEVPHLKGRKRLTRQETRERIVNRRL